MFRDGLRTAACESKGERIWRGKNSSQSASAVKMQGFIAGAGEIVEQDINDTIRKNFMPYAMSVILSRAIPEIDGFKPLAPQAALHDV